MESFPRETVKRVLKSCVEVLLVLELSDKMMRKTSVNEHWNRSEKTDPSLVYLQLFVAVGELSALLDGLLGHGVRVCGDALQGVVRGWGRRGENGDPHAAGLMKQVRTRPDQGYIP